MIFRPISAALLGAFVVAACTGNTENGEESIGVSESAIIGDRRQPAGVMRSFYSTSARWRRTVPSVYALAPVVILVRVSF